MNRREYIGRKIAEARKKKGLSQKELAEITGVDKTNISKIENGTLNSTIDTIDKLCDAVGESIRIFEGKKIFEDLIFKKHPFHILADKIGESYPNYEASKTCYQAKLKFDNKLNISVIIGTLFCSNGVDTYEVCLWSENGYQEVLGNLTDIQVSSLMEFAQIADAEMLLYLQEHGFERYDNSCPYLSYIKKYEDWYILVNPCGSPLMSSSKEPRNFHNITEINCVEGLKWKLENWRQFVE